MSHSSDKAVRCLVEGRVQGVFYRASTARKAEALGLAGSARNLDDGRVEVYLRGSPEAVAELCAWLWKGPPAARVTAVTVEDFPGDVQAGFVTR